MIRRNVREPFPQATFEERSQIVLSKDRIYKHHRLKIHFTTYDIRRGLDIINLDYKKRDIIVSSRHHEHPFRYARVIGIWHVDLSLLGQPLERIDLLWVRWFIRVEGSETTQANGLDKLTFEKCYDRQFGFIDPDSVIRACHLIPAWHYGQTDNGAQGTIEFSDDSNGHDYRFYYVNRYVYRLCFICRTNLPSVKKNRFVDRDMFMRYLGGGVGHIGGGAQQHFQGETDVSWPEENRQATRVQPPSPPDRHRLNRQNQCSVDSEAALPSEGRAEGDLEPASEEDTDEGTTYSTDSDYSPSRNGSDDDNDLAYGLD